jgi:hypothetical protein
MAQDTLPAHYTTEFSDNWQPRAQQSRSRTSDFIDWQSGTFRGERKRFDRTGVQEFQQKVERKAPTIANNPELDFRWINRASYNLTNDLDEDDKDNLGELITPDGQWVRDHVKAYMRLVDAKCGYGPALGNVVTGELGDTNTALPAAQQIAAGGTGLTVAKLKAANEILMDSDLEGADLMEDGTPNPEGRVFVCTAQQITNLLSDPQVTSADYNTVRALVAGNVNTFMGFTFRRISARNTIGLPKVSTTRSCVCWVKGALIGSKGEMKSHIDIIPTQSHKVQVRSTARVGGARLHDEGVVQVDCIETA